MTENTRESVELIAPTRIMGKMREVGDTVEVYPFEKLMRVIHAGAAEMVWSTRYEVDYGLTWDAERQVWVVSDGFAYAPPVGRAS